MSIMNADKEKLLQITFNVLAEELPDGLYDWLYAYERDVYNEIYRLLERMSTNILFGGFIIDLEALLRKYWIIHMKAIKSYKESGVPDIQLDGIRQEWIEKRERKRM